MDCVGTNRPDYLVYDASSEDLVSLVLCVDDTDDETKSTSTGKVAGCIAAVVKDLGGVVRLGTTRHQLLLREDVPYTSHNSSMAFEACLPANRIDELRKRSLEVLAAECVSTADPGLALALPPAGEARGGAKVSLLDEVVAFGKRAKLEYCSKESAYELAARIPWLSLSEHGGDGQGVVGALAGVGLRLSGSDGRFRGRCDLFKQLGIDADADADVDVTASVADVAAVLSRRKHGPVRVIDAAGAAFPDDALVRLISDAKPIYLGGSLSIVCRRERDVIVPLTKGDMEKAGDDEAFSRVCGGFEWDNDAEECHGWTKSCRNCLHRRWESEGFSCMLDAREG